MKSWHSIPGTMLNSLYTSFHFILTRTIWRRHYYYLQFIQKEPLAWIILTIASELKSDGIAMFLGLKKKKKVVDWMREWMKDLLRVRWWCGKNSTVAVRHYVIKSAMLVKSYWQMNLEWDEDWYSTVCAFELEGCAVIISEDKLKCRVNKHILNKWGALVLS